MKKIISIALILVLAISTLAGCANENTVPKNETTAPISNWDISDNHSMSSISGAYLLDEIAVPDSGCLNGISARGRLSLTVVCSESDSSSLLTVYDLSEKKAVWKLELGNGVADAGFLSDSSVCVYRPIDSTVTVYSYEGKELYNYSDVICEGNLYADDNKGLWFAGEGQIHCLKDGRKTSYPLTLSGSSPTIASVKGGKIIYAYWLESGCVGTLDIAAKEQNWASHLSDFTAGNGLVYKADSNLFSYSLDVDKVFYATLPSSENIMGATLVGNQIIINCSEKTYILNTENSTLRTLDTPEYYRGIIGFEAEGAILKTEDNKVCYLTDFTTLGESVEISEKTYTEEQLKNRERTESLRKEHGVYVPWLPKAGDSPVSDYYKSEHDQTDKDVTEFLDELEATLALFPKNLFKIMTKGVAGSVRISSANGIVSDGPNTISCAGAITYVSNGTICMAFSTSELNKGNLKEAFNHEIFHALEDAIEMEPPAEDYFGPWGDLNPEGFRYSETYSDDWGNSEYIFDYSNTNHDNEYFSYSYSKINPKEDRATIFEEMCKTDSLIFQSPHISAKAEYLTELLRKCFPELYENGDPIWLNYRSNLH